MPWGSISTLQTFLSHARITVSRSMWDRFINCVLVRLDFFWVRHGSGSIAIVYPLWSVTHSTIIWYTLPSWQYFIRFLIFQHHRLACCLFHFFLFIKFIHFSNGLFFSIFRFNCLVFTIFCRYRLWALNSLRLVGLFSTVNYCISLPARLATLSIVMLIVHNVPSLSSN